MTLKIKPIDGALARKWNSKLKKAGLQIVSGSGLPQPRKTLTKWQREKLIANLIAKEELAAIRAKGPISRRAETAASGSATAPREASDTEPHQGGSAAETPRQTPVQGGSETCPF